MAGTIALQRRVVELPGADAAAYLARRGRGMAVLLTALDSSAVNVPAELLIPGVVLGLSARALTSTSWAPATHRRELSTRTLD